MLGQHGVSTFSVVSAAENVQTTLETTKHSYLQPPISLQE